jgi:hypothetical protein
VPVVVNSANFCVNAAALGAGITDIPITLSPLR